MIWVRSIAVCASVGKSLFSGFSSFCAVFKFSWRREVTLLKAPRKFYTLGYSQKEFTSADAMLRNALMQSATGDRLEGTVWLNTLNRVERKLVAKDAKRLIFCWTSPIVKRYRRINSSSFLYWSRTFLFFVIKFVRA